MLYSVKLGMTYPFPSFALSTSGNFSAGENSKRPLSVYHVRLEAENIFIKVIIDSTFIHISSMIMIDLPLHGE